MTAAELEAWGVFAGAQVAASAALLGLLFVGMSINVPRIVESRTLVNRAASALVLLSLVLLTSTAVLVPDQSDTALGVELVVLGILSLVATTLLDRGGRGEPAHVGIPATIVRRVLASIASAMVVLAGVSLLASGGGELLWWAAAVGVAYVSATSTAWVLLVEILR